MKGRKKFECKYKDNVSLYNEAPHQSSNAIADFYKEHSAFPKTDKESFRHLKKRVNRSVDYAETPSNMKRIEAVVESDLKPKRIHKNTSVLFSDDFYKELSHLPKTRNAKAYQFEVTKATPNDKAMDLYLIKHSLNSSGINVFKMQNFPNLTSTAKDKVLFSVREEDSKTNTFARIKVELKQKGLEVHEVKNADLPKTKKPQPDIDSSNNHWTDLRYIKKTDSVDNKRCQRREVLTKDFYPNMEYKNHEIDIRKKVTTDLTLTNRTKKHL